MNVGYSHSVYEVDVSCPICGSDVYINKDGNDFRCINKECAANINARELIWRIEDFIEKYQKDCERVRKIMRLSTSVSASSSK